MRDDTTKATSANEISEADAQRSLRAFEQGLVKKHQYQIASLKEAEGKTVSPRKIATSNKPTSSVLQRRRLKGEGRGLLESTLWRYSLPLGKNTTLLR